ncbi:MAG: tRNA lysidine(34) synthetase TilS [Fastidiosipilaceae bacterium]
MNSETFIEHVNSFCEREDLLPQNQEIVVAVSGGADSMALLLVLLRLVDKKRLVVAHFNHGWRMEESEEDERFVCSFCERNHLTCVVGAAKAPKVGSESDARDQRYAFLREVAGDDRLIALAHHMEDQAETVLINLCRGTAAKGLAGMRPRSGRLIRPLLNVRKADAVRFLEESGQTWRDDDTNFQPFTWRNQLRDLVFPQLEKMWPDGGVIERVCNTADLIAADDLELTNQMLGFVDEFARLDLIFPGPIQLPRVNDKTLLSFVNNSLSEDQLIGFHFPIDRLAGLPNPLLNRLILHCIHELTGSVKDVTSRHLDRARSFIKRRMTDGRRDLVRGVQLVCQDMDLAFITRPLRSSGVCKLSSWRSTPSGQEFLYSSEPIELPVPKNVLISLIENTEQLVYNYTLRTDDASFAVDLNHQYEVRSSIVLRQRRPGDWYRWNPKRPARKLKNYMNEQEIPAYWRDHILLIANEDEVLWFSGMSQANS